ncbi:MAG: EAL domain-containing protein [Psychrobacillus psychrodurans]
MKKEQYPESFSLYPKKLVEKVFNSTTEGIMITDKHLKITLVNAAFEMVTGYSMEEVRDKTPSILKSGKQDPCFYVSMWEELDKKGTWQGEIWNRRKNSEIYPEHLTITRIQNELGETTHYFGVFTDISLKKNAEKEIKILSQTDYLTGLPNRFSFNELFTKMIEKFTPDNLYALLFIDLDRFKQVNASLGNDIGDQILVEFTKRVRQVIPKESIFARYGGDEFLLALPHIKTHIDAAQNAIEIIKLLSRPFLINNLEIYLTASIGISFFPQDGQEIDKLIHKSDKAMYFAKHNGRNQYAFYFEELKRGSKSQLLLEAELRKAIQAKDFVLHYQPKVCLETKTIIGVEALVRWENERGTVSPGEFIPLAEETGLIIPLSELIIEKVCLDILRWRTLDVSNISVSINIASVHFQQDNFIERINSLVMQYNCSPQQLELELTERTIMKDSNQIISKLAKLKNNGFKLSIDDFGTGYSSLSYLNQFPINYLKIDRSFIQHITTLKDKQAIVESIILMSHRLNIKVVAEGVETKEQVDILKGMNCDIIQGYYYSKPVPSKGLMDFLELWEIHKQEGKV